jgi:hypothetical protein
MQGQNFDREDALNTPRFMGNHPYPNKRGGDSA